jgi:GTP-binding protein
MPLTIAIVGRPNVGKSTLFNRLVGRRSALVHDEPGVTRDRREGQGTLGDLTFSVFDTAGLEEADPALLEGRMQAQTHRAIEDADICLFMIDARAGITPADGYFADLLRKNNATTVLLANKCEGRAAEQAAYEAFELGLGEPILISAEHGTGVGELQEAVELAARSLALDDESDLDEFEADDPNRPVRIAIVGRPNVGKSTLVNQLLGEERMLTGPEAGITRDSISIEREWDGRKISLFDTAGLRKRAKVNEKLERLSTTDTLRAIRFADIVVVVLDSQNPMEKQDLQIASLIENEGRGCVIAVNKWDLVEDRAGMAKAMRERVDHDLAQLKGVPIVNLSAETGYNVQKLLPSVFAAYEMWNKRVSTSDLNRWLEQIVDKHPPPAVQGRRIRIRYVTQAKTRPPTFVAFASKPSRLPDSYRRYLVNSLKEAFGLVGSPVRFMMRKGKNPYAKQRS